MINLSLPITLNAFCFGHGGVGGGVRGSTTIEGSSKVLCEECVAKSRESESISAILESKRLNDSKSKVGSVAALLLVAMVKAFCADETDLLIAVGAPPADTARQSGDDEGCIDMTS
jgi:hypothetical protein